MKVLGAAVAAVVIVGSVFSGVPAFAALTTEPAVVPGVSVEPAPVIVAEPAAETGRPIALPTPNGGAGDATTQQAPDARAQAVGKITVSGVVTYNEGSGAVAAGGATVYALRLDPNTNKTIDRQQVTAAADGTFTFPILFSGPYYFSFFYGASTGDTAMWWGATGANPLGNDALVIDAGGSATISQQLVPTATVTGTALTGNRAVALSPTVLDVVLGVFAGADSDGTQNYLIGYDSDLNADGTFEVDYVLPTSNVDLFAYYSGSDPYAEQSNSAAFGVAPHETSTDRNTVVARQIPPVAGVSYATNTVLSALYWDFMTRQPGASEVSFWNNQFALGRGLGDVSASFVNSDEYRLIRIDAAYQSILGRGPDPKGRADWLKWMQQGLITTDDIETSLYSSQEYYQQHGNTNNGFMAAIYSAPLHREGGQNDYDFWSNLIDQHGRAWVVSQFWSSTETIRERVSLMYAKYLGRTPDAAGLDHWVALALALGDSGLRSGLTGNQEYLNRSVLRFEQL